MKIIDGDYAGTKGRIVKAAFSGPVIQFKPRKSGAHKIRIPKDVQSIRLVRKEENRTALQLFVTIFLAITVIGLILAIPMFLLWKTVEFTIAVATKDGIKFVAQGDTSEWALIKQYV